MSEHRKYGFVLSSPTETLPPSSTTWGNDVVEKPPRRRWSWLRVKYGWLSAYRTTTQTTKPVLDATAQNAKPAFYATRRFLRDRRNKHFNARPSSLKQVLAFLLVLVFGIAPMVFIGYYTPIGQSRPGNRPFYGIFQDKVLSCGNSFGTPENATVTGVESLFVLDKTFGRFSFSEVKSLDVAWDILVGRGVQLIAW